MPVRLAAAPGRFCAYAAARQARAGGRRARMRPARRCAELPGARLPLPLLPVALLSGRPGERRRTTCPTSWSGSASPPSAGSRACPAMRSPTASARLGLRALRLARGGDEPLRPRPPHQALAVELELPDAGLGPAAGAGAGAAGGAAAGPPRAAGQDGARAAPLGAAGRRRRLAPAAGAAQRRPASASGCCWRWRPCWRCCPAPPRCCGWRRWRWGRRRASSSRWRAPSSSAAGGSARRCARPARRAAARRCCGCSRSTPTRASPSAARC